MIKLGITALLMSWLAVSVSNAYETSFAMKHFKMSQNYTKRDIAQAGVRQQIQTVIKLMSQSGTKTLGAEQSEAVISSYFKSMALPVGRNYDISKWTEIQCRQAIQRLEEDMKTKFIIGEKLKLGNDKKFKLDMTTTLSAIKREWSKSASIPSVREKKYTGPVAFTRTHVKNEGESQKKETEESKPRWVGIPPVPPFVFDSLSFTMSNFGKSSNVSLNEKLQMHPGVVAGQNVVMVDPYLVITRDASGKILTVWANSEKNEIISRFIADEPQEYVGLSMGYTNGGGKFEPGFLPLIITITPTQMHAYAVGKRIGNMDNEIEPNLSFGKIEQFRQSKDHPGLFIIKTHKFFKSQFYIFDLQSMQLTQMSNESDLPN